jgi:hypothetical protein
MTEQTPSTVPYATPQRSKSYLWTIILACVAGVFALLVIVAGVLFFLRASFTHRHRSVRPSPFRVAPAPVATAPVR